MTELEKINIENGYRLISAGSSMVFGKILTPQCQQELNEIIHSFVNSPNYDISIDHQKQTQQSLIEIVAGMAEEAGGNYQMGEQTLGWVRKLLCPLLPWFKEPCP